LSLLARRLLVVMPSLPGPDSDSPDGAAAAGEA
jgi:hypothetical protein